MAGRTVTRAHLHAAAYQASEISEREASALVELVLAEITRALAKGENGQTRLFRDILDAPKSRADRPQPENGSSSDDLAENGCGLPTIANPQGAYPARISGKGAARAIAFASPEFLTIRARHLPAEPKAC